jgi:hypothetical protein
LEENVVIALLGVVVGALATSGAEHFFWRIQHREISRASKEAAERDERQREERARKEQRERVAERLSRTIDLLEQGVVPWRRPWTGSGLPRNVISKKPYRRINHFLFSATDGGSAKSPDAYAEATYFDVDGSGSFVKIASGATTA